MPHQFTRAEFEAYLDEALAPDEMARIENTLRAQPDLMGQLSAIISRREAGVHTLGHIWRRHRMSCPTREQLGSYLLGALEEAQAKYVWLHVERVACRFCHANLEDLRRHQQETHEKSDLRRRKYFQSSAGYLRRKG
jgi:hypothetical protein